jgi:hypothetical protein
VTSLPRAGLPPSAVIALSARTRELRSLLRVPCVSTTVESAQCLVLPLHEQTLTRPAYAGCPTASADAATQVVDGIVEVAR